MKKHWIWGVAPLLSAACPRAANLRAATSASGRPIAPGPGATAPAH